MEAAIRALAGIENFEIDVVEQQSTVTFDDGRTDLERIKSALDESGYHVDGTRELTGR